MRSTLTDCFSDEATLHLCVTFNRHICHLWGSGNPCDVIEYEYDSLKVNVWYTLIENKVSPFFFEEPAMTGDTTLHHVPVGIAFY